MIISDISYLDITSDDNSVVGGLAYADAYGNASAYGRYFSDAYTSTYTSATSYYYYSSSSAGSSSHSTAN